MSEGDSRGLRTHLKAGVIGTVSFATLGGAYAAIIKQLPESFVLHVSASTSATAPEMVIPALTIFAVAAGIALEATRNGGATQ